MRAGVAIATFAALVAAGAYLWPNVRANTPTFTLAVPQRWRPRAGITWGTGIEPAVRIAGCPVPPLVWNGCAAGFYVRERACVPLIVRVGGRRAVLHFAIGRPCARAGRET